MQFLCFRSFLQLCRKLFTPKTIIPLFPVIRWILAESVNRTPTVDGMSCRDVPFAAGVRGGYGSSTLRAMHSIHKCVAKGAPHLFH